MNLIKEECEQKSGEWIPVEERMPERNETLGIIPNKEQLRFARRYLYSGIYRSLSWSEYLLISPDR